MIKNIAALKQLIQKLIEIRMFRSKRRLEWECGSKQRQLAMFN